MNTPQKTFSGKPESGKNQNSQSSSETPTPGGSLESAHPHGQTRKTRQPNPEAGGATGSAPSPMGFPQPFHNHLEHLAHAREQTNQILEQYNPGHTTARDALERTWQIVFELVQSFQTAEISELNTLSSIIHRLCSSFTQMSGLEKKLHDYEQERLEREEKKQQLLNHLKEAEQRNGLTPETLSDIEQMLKLL